LCTSWQESCRCLCTLRRFILSAKWFVRKKRQIISFRICSHFFPKSSCACYPYLLINSFSVNISSPFDFIRIGFVPLSELTSVNFFWRKYGQEFIVMSGPLATIWMSAVQVFGSPVLRILFHCICVQGFNKNPLVINSFSSVSIFRCLSIKLQSH
jgi:hypothetical protein